MKTARKAIRESNPNCTIKGSVSTLPPKEEKVTLEIQAISTKRIEISKSDFEKRLFHDVDFEIAPLFKVTKDNDWTFDSEFKEI